MASDSLRFDQAVADMPRASEELEREAPEVVFNLRAAAASVLLERLQWMRQAGITHEGERDLYEVLGYDRIISHRQYRDQYARGGIAGRIVDVYPHACWRGGPDGSPPFQIVEDEDPENDTELEKAWESVEQKFQLANRLMRVDKLSLLSTYAVLLIGADGELAEELPKGKGKPDDLLYFTAFSGGGGPGSNPRTSSSSIDADCTIMEYDVNPKSERFGLPYLYQLKRIEVATPLFQHPVHWSRIIHVADSLLDDDVFGQPILERVWNLLIDLEKVTGGGAEAFWLRANQGLHINIDKDLSLADAVKEKEDLKKQAEEYKHQLTRWIRTRGVDVDTLGSDVANFGPSAEAVITQVAGARAIPKRILTGSEMGELASSQDRDNWKDQVNGRQTQHCAPNIVRQLVDRLIKYSYLPAPKAGPDKYKVMWPHTQSRTETEKAEGAKAWAGTTNGGQPVFTTSEIRDEWYGKPPLTPEQIAEMQPTPPPGMPGEVVEEPVVGEEPPEEEIPVVDEEEVAELEALPRAAAFNPNQPRAQGGQFGETADEERTRGDAGPGEIKSVPAPKGKVVATTKSGAVSVVLVKRKSGAVEKRYIVQRHGKPLGIFSRMPEAVSLLRGGQPPAVARAAGFDPDQPRDEFGKWTGGAGGAFPSNLKKVGEARGTNPGGVYEDGSGQKWYVKEYRNRDQAANEQVANEVYRKVGVDVPDTALDGSGAVIASRWLPGENQTLGEHGVTKEVADKILDGFVADVFVDNWAAVGTAHDNVLVGGGKATRVDQGGSLLFRAQGGVKPEAGLDRIDEWDSFITKNTYYAQVFKRAGLKGADALGDRAVQQIDRVVAARPEGGWASLVRQAAPKASETFKERVGQMLEARQGALLKKRDQLTKKRVAAQEGPHEFSSTEVVLPPDVAARLLDFAASIPDDLLAGDGRENHPHVTVRYGLHASDPAPVRELVSRFEGPVALELGETDFFAGDEHDVLYVSVDSPDLERLNSLIVRSLPSTSDYAEYLPHATVAYLKPGEARRFAGDDRFAGLRATVGTVRFSSPKGDAEVIQMAARAAEASKIHDDWRLTVSGLARRFEFGDRRRCASFVAALLQDANMANHHPDVEMGDNGCVVTFVTHQAGDTVTDLDYQSAERADRIAERYQDVQFQAAEARTREALVTALRAKDARRVAEIVGLGEAPQGEELLKRVEALEAGGRAAPPITVNVTVPPRGPVKIVRNEEGLATAIAPVEEERPDDAS